jgi:rhodanese-related sulfurtransferase
MAADAQHADEIIERDELARRISDPSLTVVDVLPAPAWAASHIPRALSLPLAEIDSRARQVLPKLDAELALYCAKFT